MNRTTKFYVSITVIMLLCIFLRVATASSGVMLVSSSVDIDHACSYYTATTSTDLSKVMDEVYSLDISSVKAKFGHVSKLWVDVYVPQSYSDVEIEYGTCLKPDANSTKGETIEYPCEIGRRTVIKERWSWVTVESMTAKAPTAKEKSDARKTSTTYSQTLENKLKMKKIDYAKSSLAGSIQFRVCGTYTPEVSGTSLKVSIDHIPAFKGSSYPEFTWWDATWQKRKAVPMVLNNGQTVNYFEMPINVTYVASMQADFDDLRFLSNDSADAEVLPAWLVSKVDSAYAYIIVNVPVINSTPYMYYNNSAAGAYWDPEDTFHVYSNWSTGYNDSGGWMLYNPNSTITITEDKVVGEAVARAYRHSLSYNSSYPIYNFTMNFTISVYSDTVALPTFGCGNGQIDSSLGIAQRDAMFILVRRDAQDKGMALRGNVDDVYQTIDTGWTGVSQPFTTYPKVYYTTFTRVNNTGYIWLYNDEARTDLNVTLSQTGYAQDVFTNCQIINTPGDLSPAFITANVTNVSVQAYNDPWPSYSFGPEEDFNTAPQALLVSDFNCTNGTSFENNTYTFIHKAYDVDAGQTLTDYTTIMQNNTIYAQNSSVVLNDTNIVYSINYPPNGYGYSANFSISDGFVNSTQNNTGTCYVRSYTPDMQLVTDMNGTNGSIWANNTLAASYRAYTIDAGETPFAHINSTRNTTVIDYNMSTVSNYTTFTYHVTGLTKNYVYALYGLAGDSLANSSVKGTAQKYVSNYIPGFYSAPIQYPNTTPEVDNNLAIGLVAYDIDVGESIGAYVSWLFEGINSTGNFSATAMSNGTEVNVTLSSANTGYGDNITAVVQMYDAESVSTQTYNLFFNVSPNQAPTTPTLLAPPDATEMVVPYQQLNCNGSTDPQGDAINYIFWTSSDGGTTYSISQNSTGTAYNYSVASHSTYYWKCQATDSQGHYSSNTSARSLLYPVPAYYQFFEVYSETNSSYRLAYVKMSMENSSDTSLAYTNKTFSYNTTSDPALIVYNWSGAFDMYPATCSYARPSGALPAYTLNTTGTLYLGEDASNICINFTARRQAEFRLWLRYSANTTYIQIGPTFNHTTDDAANYSGSLCGSFDNTALVFGSTGNVTIEQYHQTGNFGDEFFSICDVYQTFRAPNSTATKITYEDLTGMFYSRTYYESALEGENETFIAYLPSTSETVVLANFMVQTTLGSSVVGALIDAERLINGTWTVVESTLTDSSGLGTMSLVQGASYRIYLTYGGSRTYKATISAQAQTYILLVEENLYLNLTTGFIEGVVKDINPKSHIYIPATNTSYFVNFTLNVTAQNDTLAKFGFTLYCNNTDVQVYQNNVTTSPSGGMVYNYTDVFNCSNMTMYYYFQKNTTVLYWNNQTWFVYHTVDIGFDKAIAALKADIGEVNVQFIAIFILIISMAALSLFNRESAAFGGVAVGALLTAVGMLHVALFGVLAISVFAIWFIRRRF